MSKIKGGYYIKARCIKDSAIANSQGYKDAAVNYREAIDSADTTDLSVELTASFIFIKNTGYTYSSATVLGVALDKSLKVMQTTNLICLLDSGECFVMKDNNAALVAADIHVRTVDKDGSENASAGHLAVEFLVVD